MSDELVNKDRVTITKGDPVSDFWLKGTVNRYPDYSFNAKIYDVGSVFGIGHGRISKLAVMHHDRVVMHYDRGWDQYPVSWRDRKVLKDILAGFPEPRREKGTKGQSAEEQVSMFRRLTLFGKSRQPRGNDHDSADHGR